MTKEKKSKPEEEPTKEVPELEKVEEEPCLEKQTQVPNLMELFNSPMAKNMLGGCKDLFKKEKIDTNTLEITIKGRSESVLELCKIFQGK